MEITISEVNTALSSKKNILPDGRKVGERTRNKIKTSKIIWKIIVKPAIHSSMDHLKAILHTIEPPIYS